MGAGLRRLGVLGLAMAAGLLLSSCSGAEEPDVPDGPDDSAIAASIDGETLTVGELEARSNAFFASYPQARGEAKPELVAARTIENFLRGHIVDSIGIAFDLEPTESDLEEIAVRDFGSLENYTRAVANLAVGSSRTDLVMGELRSYWIQNALRELKRAEIGSEPEQSDAVDIATRDVIDEYSAKADVTVDPRYGTWDGSVITAPGQFGTDTPATTSTPAETTESSDPTPSG